MTAFVSPFSHITTMQAQEDIMEVNADLKGNMAMEEDNIDIDFELVDVHQADGEDSMMDDEAAHLGGDGDQQMDDDVQESRDQDEEITDYAGFQPPLQEIPMTEDVPQVSDSLPSTVQPTNIFSDSTPSATTNNPSDHLQPVQSSPTEFTTAPTTQIDAARTSPPELAASSQRNETTDEPAAHDPGSPDHIGSIRNLFESPAIPEAAVQEPGPNSAEPADEAAKAGEDPSGSQPSPKEDANQTADQSVNTGRGEITEKENEVDRGSQERPEAEVEVRDETLDKPGEEESGDAQDTHDPEIGDGAENPPAEAFDQAEEGHVEDNVVEPVAILVTCQNVQMSLFPPLEDDGTPETFLLPDDKHAGKAIRSLLKACSNILADSMTEHEELELVIPALGLTFRDCLSEAEHYSIRDMSDLHFQLHQNDGIEQPGPLHVILQVRPCLSGFIDRLYTLAAEGKGIRALADMNTAGQGDEQGRHENHNRAKRTHDEHAESDQAEGDEEDEFGEPDLPESEFEFEAIEEPSDESTNEPGQEVQHITEGSLHAQKLEPSVDEAEEPSAVAKEVFSTGDDVYENQFPDGEGVVHTEFFVEETDTFHDDEARANDDEQHQKPTLAANNETSEGGDAQRHNLDPIPESSQSLHSATQPEDSIAAISHPLAEDDVSTAGEHATPQATAEQHHEDAREGSTSSATATEAAGQANTEILDHDDATGGDEDFFEDDYDGGEASLHDEDAYDGELDFGLEEHPTTEDTPQSLKRSRTAADEFGGDADADEGGSYTLKDIESKVTDSQPGHQLKRSRSG